MIFGQRRVRRTRHGDFELRLPTEERELLASLVDQLRGMLAGDAEPAELDPSLRRLFPAAYADDPARDAEYRAMVHDDLRGHRLAALDTVRTTVDADRLDEDQLLAWMGAVNDIRLVLGTRLDVSEETAIVPSPGDPDEVGLVVYGYLGVLLEGIVDALAH